jgi:hypothetical protein
MFGAPFEGSGHGLTLSVCNCEDPCVQFTPDLHTETARTGTRRDTCTCALTRTSACTDRHVHKHTHARAHAHTAYTYHTLTHVRIQKRFLKSECACAANGGARGMGIHPAGWKLIPRDGIPSRGRSSTPRPEAESGTPKASTRAIVASGVWTAGDCPPCDVCPHAT